MTVDAIILNISEKVKVGLTDSLDNVMNKLIMCNAKYHNILYFYMEFLWYFYINFYATFICDKTVIVMFVELIEKLTKILIELVNQQ